MALNRLKMHIALYQLLAILCVVVFVAGNCVPALGQGIDRKRSDDSTVEEWAAFFPEVEGCVKEPQAVRVDQREPSVFTVQYVKARPTPSNEIHTVINDELFPWFDCGSAQILITGQAKKQSVTKNELRLQRVLEKSAKKLQKQSGKEPRFYPPPPTPRSFTISGYEAIQYFPPPCDTVGCQMYQRTRITVRFAQNRQISLKLQPSISAKKILEATDFEKLNASLTGWLERRKAYQPK